MAGECVHDPACVWPWHSIRCAMLRARAIYAWAERDGR